jgi:hypothetical protein
VKHIYTSLTAATLIGCSSSIANLPDPEFMQRELVIQASQQCEDADMRPRVIYGYQRIQDRRVPVPIDVQCEPSAWRKGK